MPSLSVEAVSSKRPMEVLNIRNLYLTFRFNFLINYLTFHFNVLSTIQVYKVEYLICHFEPE